MTAATPPQGRSLAEICADALQADCGHCWPGPGRPCDCAPGVHVARLARAYRKGVISSADLGSVLEALDAFTGATEVCAGTAAA